jgi:hypothetical protein
MPPDGRYVRGPFVERFSHQRPRCLIPNGPLCNKKAAPSPERPIKVTLLPLCGGLTQRCRQRSQHERQRRANALDLADRGPGAERGDHEFGKITLGVFGFWRWHQPL